MINKNTFLSLLLILSMLCCGLFLRAFDINWDQSTHLHPDERAIVLYTLPLQFPSSLTQFLSSSSPWNPHFFAYGSLPLYLLKFFGWILSFFSPFFNSYDGITLVGRAISAIFDTGTILLLYFIGKKIKNQEIGFLASFSYMLAVLPIQLSHFYAVDVMLTFFMTLTLLMLIHWYEKPSIWRALGIGSSFGLALATKTSAVALISAILVAIAADFCLVFIKQPHKIHVWTPHAQKLLKTIFTDGVLIALSTLLIFILCEPYAVIDFSDFWTQTVQQSAMTTDPFVFPYTLQYVGIIPYFYELKQVFLWGIGPVFSLLSLFGLFFLGKAIYRKEKKTPWAQEIILVLFAFSYIAIVGKFSVGWIRYMLPVYPFFALSMGFGLEKIASTFERISSSLLRSLLWISLMAAILVWPLSFMNIYTHIHTRIAASNWIHATIPSGTVLAEEHWDDNLPLTNANDYSIQILKLYDPDNTPGKWSEINSQLAQSKYVILSSNRLYIPLQKLTDPQKDPPDRYYPITAQYYKNLFSGKLGFRLVKTFVVYPTVPFLNIPINDQGADESFTVYDHPKVLIFEKTLE